MKRNKIKPWTPAQEKALIGWRSGEKRQVKGDKTIKMYYYLTERGICRCKTKSAMDKTQTFERI